MLGGSVSGIRFERRREAVSSMDEAVALLDRLLPRRLPVESSRRTAWSRIAATAAASPASRGR
ncbi:hypothetical protein C5Q97_07375 [Victivallales bacterium CCUG 44730]|nr:hypothetical protein C5Q97_07375 [Victivallales bacterium CCUG 44730]